jgi:tetratricopeptide (TPR) repeat protein
MPTSKNEAAEAARTTFEAALAVYTSGIEAMRQGDLERARELLEQSRELAQNEPELADRAAVYARICSRKLDTGPQEPQGAEGLYRHAVFLLNAGELDEALRLLNRALADDPTSVDLLYVRACAWAKQGAAEKAVGDLRQAMAVDPKVRFQAVNDPDFERIREEPSFIDIIEPTPTGA